MSGTGGQRTITVLRSACGARLGARVGTLYLFRCRQVGQAMKKFLVMSTCLAFVIMSSCGQPIETNKTDQAGDPIVRELSEKTDKAGDPISRDLSEEAAKGCENGGIATRDEVGIQGESPLYDKPNGERIINQKATDALGKTHYQQVDKSERLEELCRTQKWSKVQVLEPSWLTDVVGWVPNSALREIERDGGGARQYVEADFTWNSETSPEKAKLIAAVNRIARDNANCNGVNPGTLFKSLTRSKPGKPVFFVTCNGPSDQPFNVWFEPR